LLFLKVGVP